MVARKKTSSMMKTVSQLVGGVPLDYHQRADGTLVVIDPLGRKLIFTAAEVQKAGEMPDDEVAK